MDKKIALATLLENSFWISDPGKKAILERLSDLTDEQVDFLGKLLAEERETMIRDRDNILRNSQEVLEAIGQDILAGKTDTDAA